MKKKFIKMNDGKNYLSLGNIINIIKKHSKVEASGIQKEVFCGVFNINDIKTTTVNNYLIGYRPIGIEYKKIYLDRQARAARHSRKQISAVFQPSISRG